MYSFLIKHFVKDHNNVRSAPVRIAYGRLAGTVGLILNLLLCAAKIAVGWMAGSVAAIADGFNSLSDAASSAITLIGFKLAAAPGDRKHPFGHARTEYLAGLFISFIIVLAGLKLFADSFLRILHPEPIGFSYAAVAVLAGAALVKVWLSLFFRRCGKAIGSGAIAAAGIDSRNDSIATFAVLGCMLVEHFSGIMLDGYSGALVAAFIVVSGIRIVLDASDPLLGTAPDPAIVQAIKEELCASGTVIGIHDLTVHDYGPGKTFATVHVEIDAHEDFVRVHDIIDGLERAVGDKLGISLVIHMDPVDTDDPLRLELKERLVRLAGDLPGVIGIHDLRVVRGQAQTSVVFDVVLSPGCHSEKGELCAAFEKELKGIDASYRAVIAFDIDYTE
ncbi:MAG: cation diffusion facilitator family transporter [Clostridiales Family XIII bacterium]|jgi:cation diffusion facilitator family transporter|nr:cation diffusion facilitator family transporter [Clostridiales Family XIII bacterium]